MNLPEMPQLGDFPGQEYGYNTSLYQAALSAWERVCKDVIQKDLTIALHLSTIRKVVEGQL